MSTSVLYVDDDRNLCQIVAKALAGEGYSVRTCHDGEEALAVLREAPPDLLLLDLMLPRRDGFAVLTELRAAEAPLRELPVVLLSGASTTPAYAARANDLGAVELLAKPVPLDSLLEVVERTAGHAKRPLAVAPRGESPARRRSAQGSFDRVSFPALLHHLHGLRASGVLHLAQNKKRKWLQLREGYPVAVRSNLLRETLGRHLLRTQRIDQEVLEDSRRAARERGMRHGEALVAMEVLSEEQIARTLREQADEKFFEIFTWTTGSFRLERGASLQRASNMGLGRSPASLILEGVRARFPLERVDRYLAAQSSRYLAPAQNPFYRFQDLTLDPADEQWLRRIDGTRTLGALRQCEEGLRRAIYALLAAGLLELRAEPAAPAPAAARGPATRRAPAAPARSSHRASRQDDRAPTGGADRRRDDPRHAELMSLADQLRAQNAHELLGVRASAGEPEISRAYERLSARTHPDRFKDGSQALRALAQDVFARVRKAYDELMDPRARKLAALEQKKEERTEQERKRSERAFQAEVESRQGEQALAARGYEAALAHFGKALELYSDEGDYHASYGYALHLCHPGDQAIMAEAMEHVKRGLKIATHREKPYLYLGRLLKAVGRAEAAEKMFLRAVQLEPEFVEALRELRLIQMRREKSKGILGKIFKR